MMNCKLLLLDYDGTLCNTKPSIIHSIAQTCSFFNRPVPSDEHIEQIISAGYPISEAFRVLADQIGAVDDEAKWTLKYREIYHDEGDDLAILYDGVPETIHNLSEGGLSIFILSNKGIAAVQKSIDKFGLSKNIQMVIADGIPWSKKLEMKPNRMVFDEIIVPKFPALKPDEILMTGDTKADIEFGNNCGIRSCWAAYGYGNEIETRLANPHFTIHSFGELEKVIS
jgi:phosphoglycolate phosphatase